MPELPEVETTVRLLRPRLVGRRLRGARVLWPGTLGGQRPAQLVAAVKGARVRALERRAKYILIHLERSGRPAGALLCHLRMTGRLFLRGEAEEEQQFVRLSFPLDRGELVFLDVRKFGRLFHAADPAEHLAGLGIEPLSPAFDVACLARLLGDRHRRLKPLLLDQSVLAGLGNIYADESLHLAGMHPLAYSDRLRPDSLERLHAAIRSTLEAAIAREGSSFDRFYRTPEGRPGAYQDQFLVYGREGLPCRSCGAAIVKSIVAQRGTHHCPRCQSARR